MRWWGRERLRDREKEIKRRDRDRQTQRQRESNRERQEKDERQRERDKEKQRGGDGKCSQTLVPLGSWILGGELRGSQHFVPLLYDIFQNQKQEQNEVLTS
jgi:hypothetical protein